jgi:hypothetical protein
MRDPPASHRQEHQPQGRDLALGTDAPLAFEVEIAHELGDPLLVFCHRGRS